MDDNTNEKVKKLILGTIPERKEEFLNLWNLYSPNLRIVNDNSGFRLEAGAYGIIQFEHKSLAQIWLFSFIVQCFFNGIVKKTDSSTLEPVYLENKHLLSKLKELNTASDIEDFVWPTGIPNPNSYKKNSENLNESMAFDLCLMAGAFIFLHEFSHLKFGEDRTEQSSYEEEFSCDKFAVDFICSRILEYAQSQNYGSQNTTLVKQKRGMAIILGLAFVLQTTPIKNWLGTDSHPSVTSRIRKILEHLNFSNEEEYFWVYFYCAFSSIATNIPLEINHSGVEKDIKKLSLSLIDSIEIYIKKANSYQKS